ncbi:hypothetical protein ACGFYO_02225 [Streptomyces sp. NPDC048201]|uniref:hypothetical protein n=1 Tax=Streptomyces sp. NPDC048201 TaxID=3365513 RepID=UPI003717F65E
MINPSSINLSEFLTTWYGAPSEGHEEATSDHPMLPQPLQDWHAIAAKWPVPLVRNKKLVTSGEVIIKDDKAIFMTDPGDAVWAFDPVNPNIIYEGSLYGEWTQLDETLTSFLLHNAINEAAYGAPYTRSCEVVPDKLISVIVAPMTEIDFPKWNWPRPGHRTYMSETLIANIGPAMEDEEPWGDKNGYSEVQVGATHASALNYLDEISEISWY